MATYYIGADVHSNNIEMAILNRKTRVKRYTIPTSISSVVSVLDSLSGKKHLAIEEGPMSGWLYRNLHRKVERFIVADPRRNKLINSDGDHDDKVDSAKLALLQLPRAANRVLKNAVLGAALSAINQKHNAFREDDERMVRNGMILSNARHTVARKLLTVMWGRWKRSSQFAIRTAWFYQNRFKNLFALKHDR